MQLRLWLLVGAFGAHQAMAADEMVQFTAWGKGNDSCASFALAMRDEGPFEWHVNAATGEKTATESAVYAQWILGFASSWSWLSGRSLDTDSPGLALEVAKYCDEHPSERIHRAAVMTIQRLALQR